MTSQELLRGAAAVARPAAKAANIASILSPDEGQQHPLLPIDKTDKTEPAEAPEVEENPQPASPLIGRLADAISYVEKVAPEHHNPLAITDNPSKSLPTFNSEGVVEFPSDAAGLKAGFEKLQNIMEGKSDVYKPEMTLEEFGKAWNSKDKEYGRKLARALGVSPTTKLSELE
jgi:hypothetical protein